MKKNIGIITFHWAINYGAILQTYALFKFLKKHNFNVKIIDYKTKYHTNSYSFFNGPLTIKNIAFHLFKSLFIIPLIIKNKKFKKFISKNLNLSNPIHSKLSLSKNVSEFDCVISGSDQVFNSNYKGWEAYFLPYKKEKNQLKMAYAPSFGTNDFSNEFKNNIREYILDFDYLSCRELNGSQFISEITQKKTEHVLDPVFLLDKSEWNLLSKQRLIKKKYIFIYDLNGGEDLVKIGNEINRFNYELILLSNKNKLRFFNKNYKNIKTIRSSGIEDFLSLIINAEAIVTDSFHGTAFSVIMEKEFYSFIAHKKASSRITSLLSELNLTKRIVSNLNNFQVINYEENNDNLAKLIDKSKKFLLNPILND